MERSDPPADGSSALQPTGFGRREVLAATGVALTGCTALGGGASYEKSDFEMEFSVECADANPEDYVARVSWEWTADEGGSSPGDRVVIYWDERKWDVALPEFETSESVMLEGRSPGGLDAVVFEHDDESADVDATHVAACSLSPKGDYDQDVRNVFVKYYHRTEGDDEVSTSGGSPPRYSSTWETADETDQTEVSCDGR
ncbi:hypothetical protein BRD14_02875 [Halobacteriales archaeon SW_5_68_122]|nr:MAG: hypothetical protein BRD14_02875 [Halobacteriales archaeon SW_5_68_122]